MDFTNEDFLKKIMTAGTLGYSASKIINVFDIDNAEEFMSAFNDPNHVVFLAFKKGSDKADFAIDISLYKNAKEGDLSAITELEKRKSRNKQQNTDHLNINQYLNDAGTK